MKPLILILVAALSVGAQSLADAARQERARQAQLKSTREFNDTNSHTTPPPAAPPAKAPSAPAAPSPTQGADKGQPASPAPTPPISMVEEQIQKLQTKLRTLEDQETAIKLQINEFTNQVFAPVTDQTSKDQAVSKLGEAQAKLTNVQKEIDQTRASLRELEAKAALKK